MIAATMALAERAEQLPITGLWGEDTTEAQRTITTRFLAFHAENPEVYRRLRLFARQAKRAGARRIGMKLLWERLRWYSRVETKGEEPFQLNNDFTSRYARLLEKQEPDLAELFETRELRAA